MEISKQFSYGLVKIFNLKKNDELHFSFDISFITENINLTYNFGESVYFSLFDFLEKKSFKLTDENYIENHLELSKESLILNIYQNGLLVRTELKLNIWEDQEFLEDFLLEWKAYCEVLMENK